VTASGGHITQVIHEAIDAVAAPDVRARIVSRALFVAGLDTIPERGPALREFVDRFLRQAVAASLGDSNADHVSQCLDPIVRLVEQADAVARTDPRPPEHSFDFLLDPEPVRLPDIELEDLEPTQDIPYVEVSATHAIGYSRGREPFANPPHYSRDLPHAHVAPTQAAPRPGDARPVQPRGADPSTYGREIIDDPLGLELAGPLELPEPIQDDFLYETGERRISRRTRKPLVLVASRDGSSVHQLMGLFHGNALLVHVDDAFTLLAALQEEGARPDVVVVDCRSPSLQPATLAALAPDLPKNAVVLLWGGDDDVRGQLRSLGARIEQWQTCDGVATPEDVANACLALVS
jgi:hypothetical protein